MAQIMCMKTYTRRKQIESNTLKQMMYSIKEELTLKTKHESSNSSIKKSGVTRRTAIFWILSFMKD
jgi:hypothetical protein